MESRYYVYRLNGDEKGTVSLVISTPTATHSRSEAAVLGQRLASLQGFPPSAIFVWDAPVVGAN